MIKIFVALSLVIMLTMVALVGAGTSMSRTLQPLAVEFNEVADEMRSLPWADDLEEEEQQISERLNEIVSRRDRQAMSYGFAVSGSWLSYRGSQLDRSMENSAFYWHKGLVVLLFVELLIFGVIYLRLSSQAGRRRIPSV